MGIHTRTLSLLLLLMVILGACKPAGRDLQTGDLLFVGESGENPGSMGEAIASATGNLTHVALVEVDAAGMYWVIDATPKRGVSRYPLDTLIQENPGAEFLVKRLRDTSGVSMFVDHARRFIGQPYDLTFLPDNDALYCSELVHDAYQRPDGSYLFEEKPMNFLSPDGTLPAYWASLFERLEMPVPQGVPGTNPQDMSASPLLETVPVPLSKNRL